MEGRLENEQKKDKSIENILNHLPSVITDWNDRLEVASKTPATRLDYLRKVYAFLTTVTDDTVNYDFHNLKDSDIVRFLKSIRTREVDKDGRTMTMQTSDSYKMTYWYCLNNLCKYLVYEHYMESNPMDNIDKPKNHDLDRINEHRVLLTARDFKRIVNAITKENAASIDGLSFVNRDKAIILTFMTTGMRCTALTEINIGDINFDEETLEIIDKGDKPHQYHINKELSEALHSWIKDRKEMLGEKANETDALFLSKFLDRITSDGVSGIVKKYTQIALGKPLSPHKLRSGFCSIMYSKTHDIEFVRRAVGHSNVATTQRYIVTNKDEKKKSAEIMESILGGGDE